MFNPHPLAFTLLCHCLSVFILMFSGAASCLAEETEEQALKPKQALSLIAYFSWTNSLPRDLIDLQNAVEETTGFIGVEKQLPEISTQIESLEWEAVALRSNPNLTYHDVISFESKLIRVKRQLTEINIPITSHIQTLETLYKNWLEKEQQVEEVIEQIEQDSELDEPLLDIEELRKTIKTAKDLIEQQLAPNLLAGQKIGEHQTRIYVLNDIISDLIGDIQKSGAQQTSPPMLSADFYKLINMQLFRNGWQNIRLFAKYQWGYIQQNPIKIVLYLSATMFIGLLIYLSKSMVMPSSSWFPFAERPLASAFFIIGSMLVISNELETKVDLPPDWATLTTFPLVISLIFLIDAVKKKTWRSTLIKQLLIFLALSLLMSVVDLPQLLSYLLVFYLSVVLVSYYLILFIKRVMKPVGERITWAVVLWGLFPISVIIAGVAGFDQFAVTIFGRVLSIVGATLIVWLLGRMVAGLLELLLAHLPFKILKSNATTIVNEIMPVIYLAQMVLWLTLLLSILWLHPTLNASFNTITSFRFTLFSLTVTPGSILTVVFIIYLSFLISRGFTAFLRQEVLPRYRVEKGVQISITRLVHYAILTLGIIFLLSVLGFGASQITIIGGALGVGIGFGLQAIVNNFVSGLILLFERPIKVGDMIEVGTDIGEVKELGLRATTVQTFDNAEIVIPNSQLITGSVINWTLAEKKIRVKVPVGVAYGSDISKVLEILLSCAEANANVLSTPKPTALFLAFGASSLDFELRVWIPDFNDKLTVLSELNQDIEYEFSLAGIEIPFPQSDLHLRSVDQELIKQMR